jgi:hypothetical protein
MKVEIAPTKNNIYTQFILSGLKNHLNSITTEYTITGIEERQYCVSFRNEEKELIATLLDIPEYMHNQIKIIH